ncbi:MAG: hypothetical protein KDA79_25390, partial [Planctomycetaceae bacterium]|nr:hypothetical protein [Planctomycetaceae bacterium]
IKDGNGDYRMLSHIIRAAVDKGQLNLGREVKGAVKEIKILGDRSAHNPRYTAKKADFVRIQSGLRVTVEELIQLAEMK